MNPLITLCADPLLRQAAWLFRVREGIDETTWQELHLRAEEPLSFRDKFERKDAKHDQQELF
jgi:hypothetical protein